MVELRLLGSCEIRGSSGRGDGLARQPKRLALLVYLALARPRGFHRRDKVLSIFWPELDERRARNALSQALHVLRTTLGERAIVTRGENEIGVSPDVVRSDVAEFELAIDAQQLESALALYRGDLLEGFNISGAPDFDRWLDAERVWLRQRASEAGWALASQKRDAGDLLGATRQARASAKLLMPDETQVQRLIIFLHELGDRSAAVRSYVEFARELAEEYELEPSAETRALADRIRSESSSRTYSLSTAPAAIAASIRAAEGTAQSPVRRSRRRAGLLGAALTVIVLGGAVTRFVWPRSPARPVVRFALSFEGRPPLAGGISGSTIALSPDGTQLVYVGVSPTGTQLFVRSMDGLSVTPIPHTEGAHLPFFAPTGEWLGFVVGDAIEKVKLSGGSPVIVCKASRRVSGNIDGATWSTTGLIVFATPGGLWRVAAAGGVPLSLLPNESARSGLYLYRWPEALPGGTTVIVTRIDSSGDRLIAVSIETGAVTSLGVDGTSAHFVEQGFLLFARRDGVLRAARFDAARLRLMEEPRPIADGVIVGIGGAVKLGVSRSGVLAYVPELPSKRLVIVDRAGRETLLPVPPQAALNARFSPDGRRIAMATTMVGGQADVWVFDQLTKGRWPVTFDSSSVVPVWTPDGRRIIVATKPGGGRTIGFLIRAVAVDGSDTAQQLLASGPGQLPSAVTPDGKALFFRRFSPRRRSEIWVLPLDRKAEPYPYLRGPFNGRAASISPDGRWVAYVSDESGKDQIYVRAFPKAGDGIAISTDGGREPRWSASGREIFYRTDSQMVAARVHAAAPIRVESRQSLFDDRPYDSWIDGAEYDVHPDGEHFVMVRRAPQRRDVVVIINWFDSVGRR